MIPAIKTNARMIRQFQEHFVDRHVHCGRTRRHIVENIERLKQRALNIGFFVIPSGVEESLIIPSEKVRDVSTSFDMTKCSARKIIR